MPWLCTYLLPFYFLFISIYICMYVCIKDNLQESLFLDNNVLFCYASLNLVLEL